MYYNIFHILQQFKIGTLLHLKSYFCYQDIILLCFKILYRCFDRGYLLNVIKNILLSDYLI